MTSAQYSLMDISFARRHRPGAKKNREERNQNLAQCLISILRNMSPAVPLPIQVPTPADDPLGITAVSDFYSPDS
jgi:hypothetical protein